MTEGDDLVKRLWAVQSRRFALWSPVMIGVGVWLRLEGGWICNPALSASIFVSFFIAALALSRRGAAFAAFFCIAVSLIGSGHLATSVRIAMVDAPRLDEGYKGVVRGRVIRADRSRSNAPRVTLDDLILTGVHPSAVPLRVRLTLVDTSEAPTVGSRISVRAVVGGPSGPAAPGAFDFSQQAYFRQIGGVGYARGEARLLKSDPPRDWGTRLTKLRDSISRMLRKQIGGEEGAIAAALIVGDRSEISDEATEALRDSGLAHLLAISGMHIGLMSALTFWLVRFVLALMPVFASRVPIRKLAAVAGLMAAGGYLALAGFGVATQRAFIMAAVAFTAILLDRPAVTARGLAAAACLVLLYRPESLFEAGFQMSFAAAGALVAGYEVSKRFWQRRAERLGWFQRFWTGLIATVATSVLAGAATTPFAAYHFNRLVAYGLPANVLATPLMGLWIMPMVILSAVLAPFGLVGVGLALLGVGIGYILWVATWVAGLEGAAWSISAGSPLALALIVFGGLWLVIWRGELRVAALLLIIAGVLSWEDKDHPDLFISENAQLVAGRTEDRELWVSRERKSGYSAETWLRRGGEGDVSQKEAFDKRRWNCNRYQCTGTTGKDIPVVLVRNRSYQRLVRACQARSIVIAPKVFKPSNMKPSCTLIDRSILDRASSIAVTLRAGSRPLVEIAEPTRLGRDQ